jgi:hypothetical protein
MFYIRILLLNIYYKTFILGYVTSKAMGILIKNIIIQNLCKILLYSQNEIWGAKKPLNTSKVNG